MANFLQVWGVRHVNCWNTQSKGFGMMLEIFFWSWFYAITMNAYANHEEIKKDFIEAFF